MPVSLLSWQEFHGFLIILSSRQYHPSHIYNLWVNIDFSTQRSGIPMHADNHVGTNRLITQETIAIPEILDLIIDNLHDDTKSLRSCSLVSKSWLPSSRYHLFETKTIYVEFYFPEIPSRVGLESFLTFILSSSAIAETVRTLILVGGLANKLPFLRHLKLQKLDLTCGHLASMSPYDSFIRLPIAKLSLYGVSIDQSINIIDNFLQHLPALLDADFTGIRLVRLGSHSQHEFMTEQDSLPHSFRSLRVSHMQQHSRAFLLTLFRCGCLSNIANLTLRAPLHFIADGLAALLASQGERLRHLEIDVTYSGDTAPISLSSCTHLTSLTLCLSILPGNSRPSWELAENIVL
ncbi:hypothetical protein ABKN59_007776 [Abortiporus biennis]